MNSAIIVSFVTVLWAQHEHAVLVGVLLAQRLLLFASRQSLGRLLVFGAELFPRLEQFVQVRVAIKDVVVHQLAYLQPVLVGLLVRAASAEQSGNTVDRSKVAYTQL